MATVDGLTAEHMTAIRDGVIVDARIDTGHLILTRYDGTDIDVGSVIGPTGDTGPAGATSILPIASSSERPLGGDLFEGLMVYEEDVDLAYIWAGTGWFLIAAGVPHTTTRNQTTDTTGTDSGSFTPFAHAVEITDFIKYKDDTHLIIQYAGSVMNNNPWGEYVVGARVLRTSLGGYDETVVITDGYGELGAKAGAKQVDDAPQGIYTISLVRKRGNDAGTVYDGQNNTNTNSLTVTETF